MASKKTAKKATKAPARNKKVAYATLPEGYKAIGRGEFGEKWDYESMPLLQGVMVGDPREVEVGTGRSKRTSLVVTVETDDGSRFDVWNSSALNGFFEEAADGRECAIAFQGYEDTGKGNPLKKFAAGYADEAPTRSRSRKPAKK